MKKSIWTLLIALLLTALILPTAALAADSPSISILDTIEAVAPKLITHYSLVTGYVIPFRHHPLLEDAVQEKINEGWQPLGPLAFIGSSNYYLACQTMVKYAE